MVYRKYLGGLLLIGCTIELVHSELQVAVRVKALSLSPFLCSVDVGLLVVMILY